MLLYVYFLEGRFIPGTPLFYVKMLIMKDRRRFFLQLFTNTSGPHVLFFGATVKDFPICSWTNELNHLFRLKNREVTFPFPEDDFFPKVPFFLQFKLSGNRGTDLLPMEYPFVMMAGRKNQLDIPDFSDSLMIKDFRLREVDARFVDGTHIFPESDPIMC